MSTTKESNKSGTDDGKFKVSRGNDSGESRQSHLSGDSLNVINEAGRNLNDTISPIEVRLGVVESIQNAQLAKIQEVKERVTETLAIFVALFTFISINFSFFSSKCLTPIIFIGLNLVLGAFLIIFVVLVRIKGALDKKNIFEIFLCIFSIITIAFGTVLVTWKAEDYSRCQVSFESIKQQVNQPKFEQNYINTQEAGSSTNEQ